ncbi:MAG: hypothetical protein MR265_00130 [Erysipelotrichaceae bacterium]|nr:hypothetical protein [Erysipelotrichaceae bacterium]
MSNLEKKLNIVIPNDSLLNHLLTFFIEPAEYLDIFNDINLLLKERDYLLEHPEEANEEAQYIDDDIEVLNDKLINMHSGWRMNSNSNMQNEIELIKKFIDSDIS